MIDLDALQKLAEAATPGPRFIHKGGIFTEAIEHQDDEGAGTIYRNMILCAHRHQHAEDLSFHAALNPQVVLELIDEIRDYEIIIHNQLQEISALKQKVEVAVDALSWYESWDWSDKYVQAVPKKAREALKKLGEK